jgi:hypothetical protein
MRAFLEQGRVIDHQHSPRSADKPVGLGQEFGLERRLVPGADGHEVMQLIVVGRRHPGGHRLQAFALARADQPSDVERAHAPTGRMTKRFEEGFKPGLKFVLPRN